MKTLNEQLESFLKESSQDFNERVRFIRKDDPKYTYRVRTAANEALELIEAKMAKLVHEYLYVDLHSQADYLIQNKEAK